MGGEKRTRGRDRMMKHLSSVICVLDMVGRTMMPFNCHNNPVNLVLGSGLGEPPIHPQASGRNLILSPAVVLGMGM